MDPPSHLLAFESRIYNEKRNTEQQVIIKPKIKFSIRSM